jgi:hypothetical protein
MRLDEFVIPAFAQMLEALSGQIDKASEALERDGKRFEVLMSARLAPDMLPLSSQIQFACTQAEEARARLLAVPPAASSAPASRDDATSLLAGTVARLRAADADADADSRAVDEARAVTLELADGMIFDLDLAEYIKSWSIPQFYFHLVTAYAIMRHHGIDLGKADYVPHMFRFLRAGEARPG